MSRIRKSRGGSGTEINWPYMVRLDVDQNDRVMTAEHYDECQRAYQWLLDTLTEEELAASPVAWGSVFRFRLRDHAESFARRWAPKRYGYAD